jgi:hypothetical protein
VKKQNQMNTNIPTYTTNSIDSIFIAFIDNYIELQYQRIYNYIRDEITNVDERDDNKKTFIDLISKVPNTEPIKFNILCQLLWNAKKIRYNIISCLIELNNTINGVPHFHEEPFVNLVNGRLLEAKDPTKINDYTRSAQKLLKIRYHIMLVNFEKINKIDLLPSLFREKASNRLIRSKSFEYV